MKNKFQRLLLLLTLPLLSIFTLNCGAPGPQDTSGALLNALARDQTGATRGDSIPSASTGLACGKPSATKTEKDSFCCSEDPAKGYPCVPEGSGGLETCFIKKCEKGMVPKWDPDLGIHMCFFQSKVTPTDVKQPRTTPKRAGASSTSGKSLACKNRETKPRNGDGICCYRTDGDGPSGQNNFCTELKDPFGDWGKCYKMTCSDAQWSGTHQDFGCPAEKTNASFKKPGSK